MKEKKERKTDQSKPHLSQKPIPESKCKPLFYNAISSTKVTQSHGIVYGSTGTLQALYGPVNRNSYVVGKKPCGFDSDKKGGRGGGW